MKFPALIAGIAVSLAVNAQPSYYNSRQYQNNEYRNLSQATQRAYSVPDRAYSSTSNSSSNSTSSSTSGFSRSSSVNITPATGPGSPGYTNIGASDRIKRQEKAGRENEERYQANMVALAEAEIKYRKLIADHGNAKNAEDHYDLVLRGLNAGIDMNAVFRVIGRDYNEYKTKFGSHPSVPFKSSREVFYEGYKKAYTSELEKMVSETQSLHARVVYLKEIVANKPSFDAFYALGKNALADRQYSEAIKGFEGALALNASHFPSLVGLGDAYMMSDETVKAEEAYTKALAINGANADLLLKAAWMLFRLNNGDEAYKMAKSAAVLLPEEAGPYLFLAALQPEGELRNSLLSTAMEAQPDAVKAAKLGDMLAKYAKYLQAKNAHDESLIFLDLAVASDPKNIDYVEMRYGTNKLLKRSRAAAEDEKTMEKL